MNIIWTFVIFLSKHQYFLMHICNSKLIEELQQIEVHLHLKLCSNMILTTFKIKFFPKAKTISLHDWQSYTIPQGRHWDSRHMLIRYQLANIQNRIWNRPQWIYFHILGIFGKTDALMYTFLIIWLISYIMLQNKCVRNWQPI